MNRKSESKRIWIRQGFIQYITHISTNNFVVFLFFFFFFTEIYFWYKSVSVYACVCMRFQSDIFLYFTAMNANDEPSKRISWKTKQQKTRTHARTHRDTKNAYDSNSMFCVPEKNPKRMKKNDRDKIVKNISFSMEIVESFDFLTLSFFMGFVHFV